MEIHGHVTSVTEVVFGSETTADLVTTDTVIPLADTADFSEEGGSVRIGGADAPTSQQVIFTYSAMDDGEESGAPSITLDSGLVVDLEAGARVEVWNPTTQTVVSEWKATVTDDLDSGSIVAPLTHTLIDLFSTDISGVVGESVIARTDEAGEFWVVEVIGKTPVLSLANMDTSTWTQPPSPVEEVLAWITEALENGRLEDSVLTNRFSIPAVCVGANAMVSSLGSPSNAVISGLTPAWRLDSATDEGVSFAVEVPKEWDTFDVVVHGVNVSTGTGAVRLVCQWNNAVDEGGDITSGTSSGSGTIFTALGQNLRTSVTVRTALANTYTRIHTFRVYRDADHAGDTLGNDWAITDVKLIAKSWVQFEPEEPPAPEDLTGRAFNEESNSALGDLRVFWNTTPPVDDTDNEDFKYFPGTDYAATADVTTSAWTGGSKWRFLWANRFNYANATDGTPHNSRPNPLPNPTVSVDGKQCRAVFTTIARANAATKAQVRHLIGMDVADVEAAWTAAGGSTADLIDEADFRASPSTYCTTDFVHGTTTYRVMVDKVVLHTNRIVDGTNPSLNPGVALDYEVQDGRAVSVTTSFLDGLATDVHGETKELFLYTNPLNGSSAGYNGIDGTNLPGILDDVDYLTVLLWSGSGEAIDDSWTAQTALLGTVTTAEWDKVVITFELGADPGTTIEDATWVYDKLNEAGDDHPSKVWFWPNGVALGGSPSRLTNQKISMICLGSY